MCIVQSAGVNSTNVSSGEQTKKAHFHDFPQTNDYSTNKKEEDEMIENKISARERYMCI